MKFYLFDTPSPTHGPLGPAHCATGTVDYEYQVEMWVSDIEVQYPKIIRIHCPELGRQWKRDEFGKFVETIQATDPLIDN